MRTAPLDDPAFMTALAALDRGVFYEAAELPEQSEPPHLRALLVIPPRSRHRPMRIRAEREAVGLMSVWAASWILVFTFLSASGAALVYHAELSDMLVDWEQRRLAPRSAISAFETPATIEIARADR